MNIVKLDKHKDAFVFYLNQCFHLSSVYIQLFFHTGVLHSELSQLNPQWIHCLIETHLGTQHKEKAALFPDSFIFCPSGTH